MEKQNFWNDAAKYGAIVALAEILFGVLGILWKSTPLSFLSVVVFIILIYVFTKRRVMLYGRSESGYSYGQCMKYIFGMMIFSGILVGAWEIVARNVLFTEEYEVVMNESLAIVANMYTGAQLDMAVGMMKSLLFSPIWIVVMCVLGDIISGCFFGLFISAFTKRDIVFIVNDSDADKGKNRDNLDE